MPSPMQATVAHPRIGRTSMMLSRCGGPVRAAVLPRASCLRLQALSAAGRAGSLRTSGWMQKRAGSQHEKRISIIAETFGDTVMDVPEDAIDEDETRYVWRRCRARRHILAKLQALCVHCFDHVHQFTSCSYAPRNQRESAAIHSAVDQPTCAVKLFPTDST